MSPLVPDIEVAEVCDAPMQWGVRSGARLLEQWERNWTSVVGAVAALEYLAGLDDSWVRARIGELAEALVAVLRSVPDVTVRRRSGETGGIVVFDVPGHDLVQIRDRLRARNVNVMFAGPQNAPIEMFSRQERGWLRASVHYFNDESDLNALATELRVVLGEI
jgi:selenocysteine lyase/cysteine desulfurase